MTEDTRYRRARARAAELRGFYTNLFTYIAVNIVLFIIDVVTGGGWWFYWVTIFWGLGLAFHAWQVFGPGRRFGDEWEERKTRELMEKDQGS